VNIPPPPTLKGFHFRGVAAHQLRQDLADEIRSVIKEWAKSIVTPAWLGTLYKFLDCIEPGTVKNSARLPWQAISPNDRVGTKIGCVFSRISWAIQLYWDQCLDGADNAAEIRQYLTDLREWCEHFGRCVVKGSPKDGHWLEVK
jgi:hypothetical protein